MRLEKALEVLRDDGFALWAGAGVSRWISEAEGQPGVPFWRDLADILEAKADLRQLCANASQLSFPQRLERVHRALGFVKFQAALRETILGRLANSILVASSKLSSQGLLPIPARARQLAKLGYLANPIVDFNVETLTSLALACAGGPTSVKAFEHPSPTELDAFWCPRRNYPERASETFSRHVYHPHGAIEISGICVITETEYRSQEATLAFELATHSAFMSNLAIVGMSLDDTYLRRQLSKFRQQVRRIFWFTNLAGSQKKTNGEEIVVWAAWAGVEVVDVGSWPGFWDAVDAHLPAPNDLALLDAWKFVCDEADDALEGKTRKRKQFIEDLVPADRVPQDVHRQQAEEADEGGESLHHPLRKELTSEQLKDLRETFYDWRQKLVKAGAAVM